MWNGAVSKTVNELLQPLLMRLTLVSHRKAGDIARYLPTADYFHPQLNAGADLLITQSKNGKDASMIIRIRSFISTESHLQPMPETQITRRC